MNSYDNKLENLEAMDKFLDTNDLPRLNYEGIENMNRQIKSNEIASLIKNLPKKKIPGPHGSLVNFINCLNKMNTSSS